MSVRRPERATIIGARAYNSQHDVAEVEYRPFHPPTPMAPRKKATEKHRPLIPRTLYDWTVAFHAARKTEYVTCMFPGL